MRATTKELPLELLGLQCSASVVQGPHRYGVFTVPAYVLRCRRPRWHRGNHSQTGIFYSLTPEFSRNGGSWPRRDYEERVSA